MESQLRMAYQKAGKEICVKVCNVGEAFTNVYNHHPELNIYSSSDMKHPSYIGSYLSACVLAATILGIDPRMSTFNGIPEDDKEGIYSEDYANILKEEAYNIVFEGNK